MNWGALLIGAVTLAVLRAHPDLRLGKAVLFLGMLFLASNLVIWFFFRQSSGTLVEVLTLRAPGNVRAGALSAAYAFVVSGLISIVWGTVAHSSAQPSAQLEVREKPRTPVS